MCKMIIYFHCAITDTKWIWNVRKDEQLKRVGDEVSLLTVVARLNRTWMSCILYNYKIGPWSKLFGLVHSGKKSPMAKKTILILHYLKRTGIRHIIAVLY